MKRLLILALLLSSFVIRHSSFAAERPNILWLIAEDMGPEPLSRSGTPEA